MNLHNDTNWLSSFKLNVTSISNRVFGNGRHQLEITVSLDPKSSEAVSDEQMNSIRLVTLGDDGTYHELTDGLYASTERDPRFEYYGDTGQPPGSLVLQPSWRQKKFYVSSTRVGGSRDVIYAAINKDENTGLAPTKPDTNSPLN